MKNQRERENLFVSFALQQIISDTNLIHIRDQRNSNVINNYFEIWLNYHNNPIQTYFIRNPVDLSVGRFRPRKNS